MFITVNSVKIMMKNLRFCEMSDSGKQCFSMAFLFAAISVFFACKGVVRISSPLFAAYFNDDPERQIYTVVSWIAAVWTLGVLIDLTGLDKKMKFFMSEPRIVLKKHPTLFELTSAEAMQEKYATQLRVNRSHKKCRLAFAPKLEIHEYEVTRNNVELSN